MSGGRGGGLLRWEEGGEVWECEGAYVVSGGSLGLLACGLIL